MKRMYKMLLASSMAVGCLFSAASVNAVEGAEAEHAVLTADASPNLLLWYKFDETSGSTVVDSSGRGFDGTYVNTPAFGTGVNGGSFKMSGGASNSATAPYVKIPNGILKDSTNMTVSAFVKWNGGAINQWLYALGIDSNKYLFATPSTGSAMNAAITNVNSASSGQGYTAEQRFGAPAPLTANVWKHVAVVLNSDTQTAVLYIDGIEAGRNTNVTIKPSDLYKATNDYSGYIGKSFYPDPYFAGEVDEFRIYNTALSASDILSLSGNTAAILNVELAQQRTKALMNADARKITMVIQHGSDMTKLAPSFTLSEGATISPASGSVQDFTHPVTYTVTGKDNKVQQWTVEAKLYNNPALPGLYADPNVVVFDNKFYIYPTTDGFPGWSSSKFKVFSSDNLVDWTDHGVILDLPRDTTWAPGNAWAPAAAEKNGKYYFYFSGAQNIGVAVADSPTGPFADPLGKPLVAKGSFSGQMIDPAVFTDDDGQSYLYFGNGSGYVAKLNDDMISLNGPVKDITPSGFREGFFVFKREGKYYLMWSENDTRDENYRVAYAIGDSPMGPFTNKGIVLQKDLSLGIKGTGHHSVVQVPGKDEYYAVYHRFAIPHGDGMNREVAIDKIEFNADGSMKPIVPTLAGIAPVSVPGGPVNTSASLTGPDSVTNGQSFDVTYALSGAKSNVYAQDVTIAYDPHQLELVDAQSVDAGWSMLSVSQPAIPDGTVRIIAASILPGHQVNGELIKLTWRSKASSSGSATLALTNVTLGDDSSKEATAAGGSYSVQIGTASIPGDMNGDRKVTVGDLAIIASYYGRTSNDPNWSAIYKKADMNQDGAIDIVDLRAVASLILN
ncbi:family 43 glycosylhydrolase [Paenibacillus puerhi]|uniref:family 43 glycosylhydrolase n=1 Tax=Paenibacillus puerhi TaxID=2692622 RepID=UPI001356851B|nr:family 43 glycosylhydrolase [Paenibacillus puerhi]